MITLTPLTFIVVSLVFFFITLYTDHLKRQVKHTSKGRIVLVVCTGIIFYCAIAAFIVACWLSIPVYAVSVVA